MPDKIVNTSADDFANVTTSWQTVLELADIELDSQMLVILWGWATVAGFRNAGTGTGQSGIALRLFVDDNETYCYARVRVYTDAGTYYEGCYAPHITIPLDKGTHNVKMQAMLVEDTTSGCIKDGRRLSTILGFAKGGAT